VYAIWLAAIWQQSMSKTQKTAQAFAAGGSLPLTPSLYHPLQYFQIDIGQFIYVNAAHASFVLAQLFQRGGMCVNITAEFGAADTIARQDRPIAGRGIYREDLVVSKVRGVDEAVAESNPAHNPRPN
jgi:hypothetical protein